MRRKLTYVLALTVIAVLGLAAAGCGGGKKSAATTEAATTAATTTEAATTAAATTEAATTVAATTTTSNISGIASAANCRQLTELGATLSSAFSGSGNSADLKKEAQVLQEFAAKTPADVRPDFKVIADYFSKIVDAVGNIKPGQTPDAATIAKLQTLSTSIDQAKLTQAETNIGTWVTKNCHA
jgi:hypothetical protein